MAPYDVRMQIWRGDATGGDFTDFTVAVEEGEVVLDAIHRVQATQAGDLAVRWNCKAGKCGSCSAEVNGRPRLLCMTRMSTFEPGETITVTPLRTFPVIKDLVTDVSFNYEQAKRVPAFAPRPRQADGTHRMQQVDVERSQEFRKCNECWLCQNVCHVIRDHEENKPVFAGPRFFIRYAELDMHPLDTNDRQRLVQEQMGLGLCNITKCCTEVCPEGIHITDNGIIPLKERVVDRKYDPVTWLGSRIPRRETAAAQQALDRGDAATAERLARERLHGKPADRSALDTLEDALMAQGKFVEASTVTRQLVQRAGRSRDARMAALNNHAWALLCAVEAGQLSLDECAAEIEASLADAQRAASTGTVLAGTRALEHAVHGRWAESERFAQESLSWTRSRRERADELLTLALALAGQGRHDDAADALAESRAANPHNPRLLGVADRLESLLPAGGTPAAPVGRVASGAT